MTPVPEPPMTLAQAIAREEGFYETNSRASRNNNPGNIVYGAFTQEHGATSGDPRFAIFPDEATGGNCLVALLSLYYVGLTLQQGINKYAPPVENNTNSYLNNICAFTGHQPSDIITIAMIGTWK